MATPTETQILTLAQWLSPAYPIGAFAYSHGLEAAVNAGWVTDADHLRDWLYDVLHHGAGRADALFLAAAWHAKGGSPLAEIDRAARAFAASRERLLETDQQGRSFGKITRTIWGGDLTHLTYPVALGAASAFAALPLGLTQTLYLQAITSNLIAAAQRLMPLGQTDGQTLLHGLSSYFSAIAIETADGDLNRLSSSVYLSDIASMKHETQYARIFRT